MKIFLLLILLLSHLFSCALCSQYTPSAHVDVSLDINDTNIQKAHISWKFSHEFIETIKPQYDKNKNGAFEPKEIAAIEKAYLDYIVPLEYLTVIKYYPKEGNATFEELPKEPIKVTSHETYVKANALYFDYNLTLNLPLKKEQILFIGILDEGAYMNFILNPLGVSFATPHGYKIIENPNYNMVFFDIVDANKTIENLSPTKATEADKKVTPSQVDERELKQSLFIATLSNLLSQTTTKIRAYLLDIKYKESTAAFFSLLLFSFLYGIIHALGPGHGKALVSSYFLTGNKNIKKAAAISTMIGIVHTFSALVLTLVVYFLLSSMLSSFMDEAEYYLTKVSGVIVVLMAGYLLYKNLPKKPKKVLSKWSTHAPTCGCHSCQIDEKKADLALILGAGMIPCPTTVLIFIFTISLGMYMTGLFSAIAMSAGMSLVIFVASALSVKAREKSEAKFSKIAQILRFLGIGIIMMLGLMMVAQ